MKRSKQRKGNVENTPVSVLHIARLGTAHAKVSQVPMNRSSFYVAERVTARSNALALGRSTDAGESDCTSTKL